MIKKDPDLHKCAVCLRNLPPSNLWVCDPCIEVGKSIEVELYSDSMPSEADAKKVWDQVRKNSNA